MLTCRLGNEKYKTKYITRVSTSNTVTWLEQFDFHPSEDDVASNTLEITLHEKGTGKDETIAR